MLTQAVKQSRFVLVGEDHVTQEIPQFAAAFCDVMQLDDYAVESGPEAAQFVNDLLHSPDRLARMSDRNKTYPNNMAFLDIREEMISPRIVRLYREIHIFCGIPQLHIRHYEREARV